MGRPPWDYFRDQPLAQTRAESLVRQQRIDAFDGSGKPARPDDTAWCERELGDVPVRARGPICATEVDIGPHAPRLAWGDIAPAVGELVRSIDGTLGRLVPVESLGRDA